MTKRQLTRAQQWLIDQGLQLNFGRVEFRVHHGEPAIDRPWRTRQDIKVGSTERGIRPESRLGDFELRREHTDVLEQLLTVPDGAAIAIEFRHGLPFRIEIEHDHVAA